MRAGGEGSDAGEGPGGSEGADGGVRGAERRRIRADSGAGGVFQPPVVWGFVEGVGK